MEDKRSKILGRVHKLLAQAAGTPFGEEANAAREMADRLMLEYTIESWEVEQAKPKDQREKPAKKVMLVCDGNNAAKDGFMLLVTAVATHCRCKLLHRNFTSKTWPYEVILFGFESDIEYTELLFTNLVMHLAKDLKPDYDPNLTWQANLVRFKDAGMKWAEMYPLLVDHIPGHPPFGKALGVKFTKVYTDHCNANGIPRRNVNPNTFVRSFVEGFAAEVDRRLFDLMVKQKEYKGPGTDIVLRDRSQEVNDLYNAHPKSNKGLTVAQKKVDWGARQQGVASGANADLGQNRVAPRKEIR